MKLYQKKSGQSILEYLIVLSAIIVVIVINTIGFSSGIQNSLGLQKSLNSTAQDVNTIVTDSNPPASVTNQSYYNAPSENIPSFTNTYNGVNYTGGYDYDTWVRNNPNSAYNAPDAGTITNIEQVNSTAE